jgi:serine/threonine protein kinase
LTERSNVDPPGSNPEIDVQSAGQRFREAWQTKATPPLADFLPPPGTRGRLSSLHVLVGMDLEARWSRGLRIILDDYVRTFPELGLMGSLPVKLIFQEYRARVLFGDRPALETYRSRFPLQFSALQRMAREQEGTLHPPTPDGSLIATIPNPPPPPPPVLPPLASPPAPATSGNAPSMSPQAPTMPPLIPSTAVSPLPGNPTGTGRPHSTADMVTTYRLLRILGQGQFGEVFLAEAPGGHEVAVKRMLTHLNEEGCRKELQALELLRKLRHPFLLEIHASWVQDNRLHVAMQLADGSLAERFAECKKAGLPGIPRDELIGYFTELAEAMDYLHQHNVMHRDIKPANLLLHKGHAKVADFGLARHLDPNEISGTFCGTPAFMGPEVYSGEVSFPADQYSLACSYVEMRRGEPPYSGRNPFVLAQQVLNDPPDLKGLPSAEQKVLARALAKVPGDRFPNCAEFVKALRVAATPPPKPPTPGLGIALLVGVGVLVAALLVVLSLPMWWSPPTTTQPPPTTQKSVEPWLPTGFHKAEGDLLRGDENTLITVRDQPFWRFIVADEKFKDAPIVFVLISGDEEPPRYPYYISREKITQQQFHIALNDPEMRALLQEAADKNPAYVAEQHKGWLKMAPPPPAENAKKWPQDGLTVPEAYCFAQYVSRKHGNLPTVGQWDKAAHHPPDDYPYRKADWEKAGRKTGVAVGQPKDPLDSGASEFDVCEKTRCRDMAGNGVEMTRTLVGADESDFPYRINPKPGVVAVPERGANWTDSDPFHFPRSDKLGYAEGPGHDGHACFRVVLELLP